MSTKTETNEVKSDKETQSKEASPAKAEAAEQSPAETKPLTDADVIEMGELSLEEGSAPDGAATTKAGEKSPEAPSPAGDSQPVKPAAEAAPAPKKEYVVDGKEFDSAESMAAYLQGKMEKGDNLEEILAAATEAKADKPKSDAEELKEIGELFFDDPAKALEMMEKRVERKFDQKKRVEDDQRASAQRSKDLWDSFYGKNPDLKSSPEIVNAEFNKILKANPNMGIDEGHRLLAEASRKRLMDIADAIRPAKELPDGPAVTGDSKGAEVTRSAPSAPVEDFMTQMRKLRKQA